MTRAALDEAISLALYDAERATVALFTACDVGAVLRGLLALGTAAARLSILTARRLARGSQS